MTRHEMAPNDVTFTEVCRLREDALTFARVSARCPKRALAAKWTALVSLIPNCGVRGRDHIACVPGPPIHRAHEPRSGPLQKDAVRVQELLADRPSAPAHSEALHESTTVHDENPVADLVDSL